MTLFTTSLRRLSARALAFVALLLSTTALTAQTTAPTLGTVAPFGAFTGAGAIENTGLTVINGDIGTNVGSFTGFPPGIYTGAKHVADAVSLAAKNDLILAYNSLNDATNAVIFDTAISSTMGNGQVLTPRTYGRGDLTTLSGTLTFDAEGDSDAIFIVKIRAALNVAANTRILLANGARAENIYWAVDGAVSILNNTSFKGTILSNGAIHLYGGSNLEGRALAVVGAVTFASSVVTLPGANAPESTLIVITPATGERVERNSNNYRITWGGTGIDAMKTFEYSLDSGATWTMIDTATTNGFFYNWDVPDTVSNRALVRITDGNDLRGVSGMFSIVDSLIADTIIIVRPAAGERVIGDTDYLITWSGTGIAPNKTLEYSLDSGATWMMIDTVTNNAMTYNWGVPDTVSDRALIRITDADSLRGVSGMFSIVDSLIADSILIVRPTAGERIFRNTPGYQITWTGSGITDNKTLEYSLDSGATWHLIGTANNDAMTYSWNVPDTVSDRALIRITDANNLRGVSGMFRIVSGTPVNSLMVVRPAFGERIQRGTQDYQILWTGTGITPRKTLEYSLDSGATWRPIATVTSTATTYNWDVPDSVSDRALVRITDENNLRGVSGLFAIVGATPASSIIVVRPTTGEILQGGSQNYQIVFTATNTAAQKLIEYSIDGGETWIAIGTLSTDESTFTWSNVPNVSTTRALIRITDINGVTGTSGMFTITRVASVGDDASSIGYEVSSYPNPASGQVTIGYLLPTASDVTVTLVDATGRQVATLVDGRMNDGAHSVTFDTSRLAAGIYAYVLQTETTRVVGRMTVVR